MSLGGHGRYGHGTEYIHRFEKLINKKISFEFKVPPSPYNAEMNISQGKFKCD